MEVLWDVRRRGMGVVVGVSMGGECERERKNGSVGRENKRISDHGTCSCIVVGILDRFDRGVVGENQDGCVARFIIFDHVDSGF